MDQPELPSHLQQIFTPEFIEQIRQSLHRGYQTAIDLHDESRGGNENTFGLGLYHYNWFELTQASLDEAPFKVKRTSVFRLIVGDCILACHRVGRCADDDIMQCYPGNVDATIRLIQEQFEFEGDGFGRDLTKIRRFMIAHLGNSTSGLEAIYLTVPRKTASGIEWIAAFLLWKRDVEAVSLGTSTELLNIPDQALRAPEEQIPDRAVPRKKKKNKEEEQS